MSFTNTIVDKVYVINLDKDKDRLEKIDAQLKKYNILYERFPAIQGCSVKNSPLLTADCNTYCTDGIKGCALSHKTLWAKAVQEGYRSILILEDDAILADDFDTKLKHAWYQVPEDYDFVFLGCRFHCNTTDVIPRVVNHLAGNTPVEIDTNVSKVNGTMGTHGYIISFHAAKLLEDVLIRWHIDYEISNYIVPYNLHVYSIKPTLVDVIDDQLGSNLSEVYPPLLNSLLNIRLFEHTTFAWLMGETAFRLGPFNISGLLIALFFITLILPTWTYKYTFLWLFIEFVVSGDVHSTVKFIAFLSVPMVIRYKIAMYSLVPIKK